MRYYYLFLAICPPLVHGFSLQKHSPAKRRSGTSTSLKAIDENAVSSQVNLPIPPPPPPRPESVTTFSSDSSLPLPAMGAAFLGAFAIATFAMRNRGEEVETKPASAGSGAKIGKAATNSDVSIPYDSAALLAYDDWRVKFNKGSFDPTKFEAFKSNYIAATVANVIAKKKARENGGVPTMASLDQNADGSSSASASTPPSGDVSIPYDSAALLAYDDWRRQFNKGAFDASKFAKFKATYEKITVTNIVAKKKAREGLSIPVLQSLPATADE